MRQEELCHTHRCKKKERNGMQEIREVREEGETEDNEQKREENAIVRDETEGGWRWKEREKTVLRLGERLEVMGEIRGRRREIGRTHLEEVQRQSTRRRGLERIRTRAERKSALRQSRRKGEGNRVVSSKETPRRGMVGNETERGRGQKESGIAEWLLNGIASTGPGKTGTKNGKGARLRKRTRRTTLLMWLIAATERVRDTYGERGKGTVEVQRKPGNAKEATVLDDTVERKKARVAVSETGDKEIGRRKACLRRSPPYDGEQNGMGVRTKEKTENEVSKGDDWERRIVKRTSARTKYEKRTRTEVKEEIGGGKRKQNTEGKKVGESVRYEIYYDGRRECRTKGIRSERDQIKR
ncbi:hypothetical protein Tco_0115241 [Tanacetum coccineum]